MPGDVGDCTWFVTWKNKHQIRAQEVKRYRIDMFILNFDQFLEKNKMAARPEVVRRTKKNKTRFVLKRSGAFKKTYFYSILTKIQNGGQMMSYWKQ